MNHRINLLRTVLLLLATSFIAVFSSCTPDNVDPATSIDIVFTNVPDGYGAMKLEIDKIEFLHADDGWFTSDYGDGNPIQLSSVKEVLVADNLPIRKGDYRKIRITYGKKSEIYLPLGGNKTNFKLQDDQPTEITANFSINPGGNSKLSIDFLAGESNFERSANTRVYPEIHSTGDTQTGVSGQLDHPIRAFFLIEGSGLEFTGYSDSAGRFEISGIEDGHYDIHILDEATRKEIKVIEDVRIVRGRKSKLGIINVGTR